MKDFMEGLASLLNIKPEEVSEMFDTEGKLKEDVKPLEKFSNGVKNRLDDVYKAAQRKTSQNFESWVKSQGFKSDSQGVDLLAEFYESVKSTTSDPESGGEWESKYNDLLPKVENLQSAIKEKEAAIEKAILDGQRREVSARLRTDVKSALGKNWAGSDQHLAILMQSFNVDSIRYDKGVPVMLDETGEPIKDELHRPISFADRTKELGTLIGGFHAVDPNKGAPPAPTTSGAGQSFQLQKGLTNREYNEIYDSTKDPVQRKKLAEARIAQLDEK